MNEDNTESDDTQTSTRKISPWGNSLGVRLPDSVIGETAFTQGQPVRIKVIDPNTVQIERVPADDEDVSD